MNRRSIAALSTLALGASGLGVAGLVAPAQAATPSLAYSCVTPLGVKPFATTFDTNAPASVKAGAFKATLNSKVAVDAELMGTAYSVGARSIDGSAVATITVGGKQVQVTSPIPKTNIPASGPLALSLSGPLAGTLPAGPNQILAGNYVAHLKIYGADGSPLTLFPTADATCTAPAAGSKVVDAVAAQAKAKAKVTAKAKKGSAKVTVKVTGYKAGGKVKITLKGKQKVTKTVKVKNGKAVVNLKKLKKGSYKITAAYAGDRYNTKVSAKGKVTVK